MSVKSDVVALLAAKKDEKLAAVAAEFDTLISTVEALPEDGDVVALQQQVADLQAKVDAANAEIAKDVQAIADEQANEAKLQAKIDAIKAALEG